MQCKSIFLMVFTKIGDLNLGEIYVYNLFDMKYKLNYTTVLYYKDDCIMGIIKLRSSYKLNIIEHLFRGLKWKLHSRG